MRQKIVAGNWKMNKLFSEGISLLSEIQSLLEQEPAKNVKPVIIPSFIFIPTFVERKGTLSIGAQNCAGEASGAFTGEVSAALIKSAGAEYVIVGHSERRSIYKETNDLLAKKIDQVILNHLIPIFCIGETLKERESKTHFNVVKDQLVEGVFHLRQEVFSKIIIAYEPVWAIGTGVTATSDQAQEMHAWIREVIEEKYSSSVSEACTILYGGSCNAQNAKELAACPDVDGGLIGGASLKAADFVKIIQSF